MNKAELENGIRNEILTAIIGCLSERFDTDVLPISTSGVMMPAVDAEGNEKYAVISVNIPRGTRANGTYIPYNGYEAAEDYRLECETKAEQKRAKEEEAAREQERKRAKKTKKMRVDDLKEMASKIAVNLGEAK